MIRIDIRKGLSHARIDYGDRITEWMEARYNRHRWDVSDDIGCPLGKQPSYVATLGAVNKNPIVHQVSKTKPSKP